MNEKLINALEQFQKHFHYNPEFPPDIDFEEVEYANELLKCIEDNFDYTIKKYGTIPRTWKLLNERYEPDYID